MMWLADKYAHIYYLHGSRIEPMLVKRIGIPERCCVRRVGGFGNFQKKMNSKKMNSEKK